MRRIFWKILLSFWLALLLTGIGTAAIVTLYQDAKAVYSNLETGDRPNGITESIARTMLSGGKKLLQDIVKPQNLNINKDGTGGPPLPYVVDQQGKDVFERTINPKVLAEAQRAFFAVLGKYTIADVCDKPETLLRHLRLAAP